MNVPNRYKGFSQLPENVQQRMDPSLAKKYQMGGSVMQRPLFRQMGGPTDMMPQDMMPPPPMGGAPMPPPPMAPPPMGVDPAMEAQLMDAENTGQQIGAQFSEDMMMNLEGAEDYQSLIDGIRGNQLPIDARYQELAGYVGEQDAMATPESVLALTQPTIMMTEQGAMDSGIGELMQGIAGDVPMEGPMDEGVGALMAAGAGNTPPVNFRNGGPVEVRGYSNGAAVSSGGGSRIMAQAERDASGYEKYFAGGLDQEARAAALAEQNEMAKAQMLFDIAGTALNFAGNTQGNTIAERLANAAAQTQLTDKIGARSAGILTAKQSQAAEERQLRMAARQASLNQAQADDTFRKNLELASAKKSAGTPKFETLYNVNGEGNLTGQGTRYDLTDPLSLTRYNAALRTGKYRDATTAAPFLAALGEEIKPQELTQVQVTAPITVDGYTYKIGEIANLTPRQKQDNARKWSAVPEKVEFVTLNKGTETKLVITNAPGSGKTLQTLSDLGWSTSTLEGETAAKKEIISFTQGFNKDAQARLFANQKELAGMSDKTTRRGQDLQEQIARDGRELQKTLQDNRQLFTTGRDQTLQGYKTALKSYSATIDKDLLALKGQQGVEIEKLRAELRDQSSKVSSELSLANQLSVAKVKRSYEIERLTTTNERSIEIEKLRSALGDASRQDQNVFKAAESLLNRVADTEGLLSQQEWKNIQNELDRNFKGTEAEKKAAALLLQNIAKNNMTAEGLDLQEARDLVSKAKGEAKTILDRERFELEKAEEPLLAAKGTDATIKALSDQDKLDRYATNTMPATEANQFDMIIEYWAKKQSEKWSSAANDGQGGYVPSALTLGPALKKAIAARVAILGQENVPDLSNASNFVVRGAPGSVAAYAFNEDGTVNPDSFNSDNTLIISGVDLSKSQGIASGFNRVFKNIGSFIKEISLGFFDTEGGPSSKVGVTRRADAELDALARKTIELGRSGVEGKVFALDVKLLEEEVKNFKASAFGTDRGALDQLYVTRASMAAQFGAIVDVLNGGTKGGYTELQVTTARATKPKLEELLGEYTAAILIYERSLDSSSSAEASTASDQVQTGGSLTRDAGRVN